MKNELQTFVFVRSVPPSLSAWLETDGEQMVAVCQAERGKPAANISWIQTGRIVETALEHGGFVTVESRLELLQGTDTENLTCVINHPYWRDQQILLPQLKKGDIKETNSWHFSPIIYLPIYSWGYIIVLQLMNGSTLAGKISWITIVAVVSAAVLFGGVLVYVQMKLVVR